MFYFQYGRNISTSIMGWPYANPFFSSRNRFMMTWIARCFRVLNSSGEPYANSRKKWRLAHGTKVFLCEDWTVVIREGLNS